MMKVFALLTAAILCLAATAEASPPSSFSAAKRLAEQQIYHDQNATFYCGCEFSFEEGPELESCGYQIRKQPARANRIEWEHVMPAYDFGRQRQCWQEGGRDNCRRTDLVFRMMEADLHNLVPAIGEVNGDRSNMRFAMVNSPVHEYGACDIAVSFDERAFQPPPHRRGDIARTYWYMRDTYGIEISRQQQQLFTAWANQDPVDDWEIERNRRIAAIQGNGNTYVSNEDLPTARGIVTPPLVLENRSSTAGALPSFSCDTRKTCGQMSSCNESYFHLLQCGNGRLDGDNDGVPCESICR
ncbi:MULTISPECIES: endonuclease [unclassified Halomonas]|uniref:endonuclease n=1 Tax=unclassified Halomonas TaxID=2609666 RepID=UPI00256EEFD5|nr:MULTISPECIES: endonuclease [unclassified Halomonas]